MRGLSIIKFITAAINSCMAARGSVQGQGGVHLRRAADGGGRRVAPWILLVTLCSSVGAAEEADAGGPASWLVSSVSITSVALCPNVTLDNGKGRVDVTVLEHVDRP